MNRRAHVPLRALVLPVVVVFAACQDVPTDPYQGLEPVPAFAKGGKKADNPPPAGDRIIRLGAELFADESLSVNGNQSCQTCHHPDAGFAAPDPKDNVDTKGSVVHGSLDAEDAFGDRKPPSAAYATVAPSFSSSGNNALGGNFWDGRATGELLGNPAADQALGPFLNPKEQAMPDKACVVWRVALSGYALLFEEEWGTGVSTVGEELYKLGLDVDARCGDGDERVVPDGVWPVLPTGVRDWLEPIVNEQYDNIARSIAAFEAFLNTFDSPFDLGELSDEQLLGEQLFGGKGKCQQCHDNQGSRPLFTDFEYHNLGVPLNPNNPVHNYESGTFDPGLEGFTRKASHLGKFKTPTVRNVWKGEEDRTFMHNGSLVSLWHVVQFYNTRDILPECTKEAVLADPWQWGPSPGAGCWPPAEYPDNLDTKRMGNLGLTDAEVDAIVEFMKGLNSQVPSIPSG